MTREHWIRAAVLFAIVHLVAVLCLYGYALAFADETQPDQPNLVQLAIGVLLFPLSLSGLEVGCGLGLVLILASSVLWGLILSAMYVSIRFGATALRRRSAHSR